MAVGETKKSMDAGQFTWFQKNVRQVCDSGFGRRVMYLETVASEISMPSFMSSPWTRGAPQSRRSVGRSEGRREVRIIVAS